MGGDRSGLVEQRSRSLEASKTTQAEEARHIVRHHGLDLVIGNDGHHWRFVKGRTTILSFWPASAKAQRPGCMVVRCRGYKAAVEMAARFQKPKER